jgi:pantoate--beta-alanine ligase
VVRNLARDLNVPVQVIGVPTVRERDGLALSSRNRHLTLKERSFAPCVYKALLAAQQLIAGGERDAVAIKEQATDALHRVSEIRLEYFDLVDPDTIQPVNLVQAPVRVAIAAWIGKTRLIDNVLCEPPALAHRAPKKSTKTYKAPNKSRSAALFLNGVR